jgi:F-type H+-transporting ATPase subunit epsilon
VDTLYLEIITPERVLVREEVEAVEAQGALGEFGILPGHTRFLTTLVIGEARYTKGGSTRHLATSGGFAEVTDNRVTLLLDTAEFCEDIDVERAKKAEQRATNALRELDVDAPEYEEYSLALGRALARITVASKA